MIVLGIDFGMRHWGVAIGHSITSHTEPLGSIPALNGMPDIEQLNSLIDKWNPESLIIGYPLKMDGSEFNITKDANNAAKMLQEKYSIPVYQVDERMTSVEARDELFKRKGKKGLTKGNIDSLSAQLILERWFQQS